VDSNKPKVHKIKAFSPVWLVPIVAILIATGLAVQAWNKHGPTVEIYFNNADGIQPAHTNIRYKNVDIGKVKNVRVTEDLSGIIVTAELAPEFSDYLSDNTKFWVVSPRISLSGISGLNTLLSGVYIEIDPGKPGKYQPRFAGLDEPPLVRSDSLGSSFTVFAKELGSVDISSPVYFRQIKVGEITSYKLVQGNQDIEISLFVESPYDEFVTEQSRFWNVSGFEAGLGANGLSLELESLSALVSGGVAFDSPYTDGKKQAQPLSTFFLLPNYKAVLEGGFVTSYRYGMRFTNESVKGLEAGSPVEYLGIKVGDVESVTFETVAMGSAIINVTVNIQPERMAHKLDLEKHLFDQHLNTMIDNGLRAQLKTGNILTGGLIIELIHHKAAKGSADLAAINGLHYIPTASGDINQLTQQLASIVEKIDQVPITTIGNNLSASLSQVNKLLTELNNENFSRKVTNTLANIEGASSEFSLITQSAATSLEQLKITLKTMEETIAPDSQLYYELLETMRSISESADSVRNFTDELNRHPQSLILGK